MSSRLGIGRVEPQVTGDGRVINESLDLNLVQLRLISAGLDLRPP